MWFSKSIFGTEEKMFLKGVLKYFVKGRGKILGSCPSMLL